MDAMFAAIGNQIPNEVKLLIAQLLPRKDQWIISRVSQEWRRVAHSVIGDDIDFSEALRMLNPLNSTQSGFNRLPSPADVSAFQRFSQEHVRRLTYNLASVKEDLVADLALVNGLSSPLFPNLVYLTVIFRGEDGECIHSRRLGGLAGNLLRELSMDNIHPYSTSYEGHPPYGLIELFRDIGSYSPHIRKLRVTLADDPNTLQTGRLDQALRGLIENLADLTSITLSPSLLLSRTMEILRCVPRLRKLIATHTYADNGDHNTPNTFSPAAGNHLYSPRQDIDLPVIEELALHTAVQQITTSLKGRHFPYLKSLTILISSAYIYTPNQPFPPLHGEVSVNIDNHSIKEMLEAIPDVSSFELDYSNVYGPDISLDYAALKPLQSMTSLTTLRLHGPLILQLTDSTAILLIRPLVQLVELSLCPCPVWPTWRTENGERIHYDTQASLFTFHVMDKLMLELDNLRVLELYVSFKEEDFTGVLELPILGWPVPLKVLNLGLTPAPPDCVPDFFFDQYLADTGHLVVGPMYSNIRYAFTNMHDMHQCVLHAQQGWQRFTARHRGTIEAPGRSL